MAKTRSMSRNQDHDKYASRKKKVNSGVGPWSDLNHDLLYLVMKQLGVVDYLSFGGVCKSWRSLAISDRNMFMASKPPMTMRITLRSYKKACYLEDFEGRKFKTILSRFMGGAYVGLTCGYLIFFTSTTRDFWLVNPVTRHQLYFTDFPMNDPWHFHTHNVRAILVFSLSICGWVFLVMRWNSTQIWYSIAATGAWNHVSCKNIFTDLCAFKGTIYTLNRSPGSYFCEHVYELRLNPEPKLTLLDTKNFLKPSCAFIARLVSSGEKIYLMDRVPPNGNIYMMNRTAEDRYRFQELDFDEMKWVMREKTLGEYASFLSNLKHGVAEKPVWGKSREQGLLVGHNTGDMLKLIEVEKASAFTVNRWYFPHECLNVDRIDE